MITTFNEVNDWSMSNSFDHACFQAEVEKYDFVCLQVRRKLSKGKRLFFKMQFYFQGDLGKKKIVSQLFFSAMTKMLKIICIGGQGAA